MKSLEAIRAASAALRNADVDLTLRTEIADALDAAFRKALRSNRTFNNTSPIAPFLYNQEPKTLDEMPSYFIEIIDAVVAYLGSNTVRMPKHIRREFFDRIAAVFVERCDLAASIEM